MRRVISLGQSICAMPLKTLFQPMAMATSLSKFSEVFQTNYLECFHGTHKLHLCVPNVRSYELTSESH